MARLKPTSIQITGRQKKLLEKYLHKRTGKKHYQQRVQIILIAAEGKTNNDIKRTLGITNTTVRLWRDRWALSYRQLLNFEKGVSEEGVSDTDLLKQMLDLLSDEQRSGAPSRITMSQKKEIVAMACSKPSDYGAPVSQWSHELLAQVAGEKGIVESISSRHVGNILKKLKQSPINQNTGSIPK